MNFVKELTFGPPKCWKTGSKVSTYPRPLLVLSTDVSGLSVIAEPMHQIPASEIEQWTGKLSKDLPPLAFIDFNAGCKPQIMVEFTDQGNSKPFMDLVNVINKLCTKGCPWQTIVLDDCTGLDEIVKAHNAVKNPSSLANAMKWAALVGGKMKQILSVLVTLPSHVVILCHASQPTKDEDVTNQVQISTVMTSQRLRAIAGGLVNQFLYQEVLAGKPVAHTTDFGFVRGIGCRWPANLKATVPPTWEGLYGEYYRQHVKELQ